VKISKSWRRKNNKEINGKKRKINKINKKKVCSKKR
jgi:hypothetical protein